MENINDIYSSLEEASDKIQEFLDNNQINATHSSLMLKLEELNNKMYDLDLEAIKNRSESLMGLNEEFKEIRENAEQILEDIDAADDFIVSAAKVTSLIDKILTKISRFI